MFESGLLSASFRRKQAMLAVVESYSRLLAAGGLSQQQITLWQALLEFNVDTPIAVAREPVATRLRYFEAFWESDYQRIGDVGKDVSCGWGTWLHQKLSGQDIDPVPFSGSTSSVKIPSERDVWGTLGVDETIGYFASLATPTECHASDSTTAIGPQKDASVDRIEMVYSALHGYRIPMKISADDSAESTSSLYERILGELREESGTAAAAEAKAARLAQKVLQPSQIPESDPLITCELYLVNSC